MKTALVLTVKNEARLLRQNLLYHLAIGVEKIFVYFDGTTDDGKEQIDDLPNVVIQDSVSAKKYVHLPYLEKFWSNAQKHHTARQCLNTFDALKQCEALGFEWLISLDADEVLVPDISNEKDIRHFFSKIPEATDIVRFKTFEVIGRKEVYQNVIAEETWFKTQKNFKSHFDNIFIKIENPYSGKNIRSSFWLGHTMGKSAIRTKRNIIPKNVHRYSTISGTSPTIANKGYLLHYHLYDFPDFVKKYENFKNRATTYLSGNNIDSLKSLWIRMINDQEQTEEKLKEYFQLNLFYDGSKLKRLQQTRYFNLFRRKEDAVVEVDFPKKILSQIPSKILNKKNDNPLE